MSTAKFDVDYAICVTLQTRETLRTSMILSVLFSPVGFQLSGRGVAIFKQVLPLDPVRDGFILYPRLGRFGPTVTKFRKTPILRRRMVARQEAVIVADSL